jgi:hypothetical protein
MSTEFVDDGQFPWHLPDANAFHKAISSVITEPARIDLLYQSSGRGLKQLDLSGSAPDVWQRALTKLAAASLLRSLGVLVLEDVSLVAIHPATTRFVNLIDRAPTIKPLSKAVSKNAYESLTRIRTALPNHIDPAFIAQRLVRRVEIDRPNALVETDETLMNISGDPMNRVVRLVVTDSPTEFEDLKMQATFEFPNAPDAKPFPAPLTCDVSDDRKQFSVKLTFKTRVVPQFGVVTIRWHCVVPASVGKYEDYWVFPHIFSKPTQQTTLEALFDRDPEDVNLYLDQYNWELRQEHLTPIPMKDRREEVSRKGRRLVYGVDLADSGGTYMFTWRFKK